jgi:lysophospholipase L1-like esterase
VLLSGCILTDRNGDGVVRVACLGDSMTAVPAASTGLPESWCNKLQTALMPLGVVDFLNEGFGGTTAYRDAGEQEFFALWGGADVLVFAFGTNDVILSGRYGWTAADIAQRLHDLAAVSEGAGVPAFVATVPPDSSFPARQPMIADINARLRADASLRLIDFDTGFTDAYFVPTGLHVNDAGQALRTSRVLVALAVAE